MSFDPANPETWPTWMRPRDICTSSDHRGPYPGSKAKWFAEVAAGRIPPPVKFGARISAWHRNTVAAACRLPLPDEQLANQST